MIALLLVGLAAVSAVIAARTPRGSPRRPVWTLLAVFSLAVAAATTLTTGPPEPAKLDDQPTARTSVAALRVLPPANPEYVGANACRGCHAEQFSSWHDSYHRTMTQRATPEAVLAPFEGVVLRSRGREFRLERDGDTFRVDMPDPALEMQLGVRATQTGMRQEDIAAAVNQRRVQLPIVMATGSHLHQTYWVPGPGGLLFQFPWVYHIKFDRWVPRYDSFLSPPHQDAFFNVWNVTCVLCHATAGVPGQDDQSRVMHTRAELGIACEACHGPGREHVQARGEPLLTSLRPMSQREPDPTIVNPARLDHVRAAHVCAQCHSYFSRTPQQYQRWLTEGNSFRPGDDLEEHRLVLRYDPQGHTEWIRKLLRDNPEMFTHQYWPDGTARTGGREFSGLLESACFLDGEMSCLSCHSMHNSDPADQLAPAMETNRACTQCHGDARFTDDVTEHTHHPAGSSGSLCYNCHMPHTTYVLMGAVRSHRIVPPEVVSGVRGARPNACNLCHLDQTLDWTSRHLAQWHGTPRVDLSDAERDVAASLLWLLQGDATQRLMVAWSMGWQPAQETSGDGWEAPFLAVLLEDPYSAIRDVAHRSLKTFSGYEDVEFNFLDEKAHFEDVANSVRARWREQHPPSVVPGLLISGAGRIDHQKVSRLLAERDERPIEISE